MGYRVSVNFYSSGQDMLVASYAIDQELSKSCRMIHKYLWAVSEKPKSQGETDLKKSQRGWTEGTGIVGAILTMPIHLGQNRISHY